MTLAVVGGPQGVTAGDKISIGPQLGMIATQTSPSDGKIM